MSRNRKKSLHFLIKTILFPQICISLYNFNLFLSGKFRVLGVVLPDTSGDDVNKLFSFSCILDKMSKYRAQGPSRNLLDRAKSTNSLPHMDPVGFCRYISPKIFLLKIVIFRQLVEKNFTHTFIIGSHFELLLFASSKLCENIFRRDSNH